MRVMVMIKENEASETGEPPSEEIVNAIDKYNEELTKAGVLLAAEGLLPSSTGKRVRFSGAQKTVIDGPFAETKELIAGFWIWQVRSMEEAVEWLKRGPFDDVEIEIRPVFDAQDSSAQTAETGEQEAR